jgi:hypothetical protein
MKIPSMDELTILVEQNLPLFLLGFILGVLSVTFFKVFVFILVTLF